MVVAGLNVFLLEIEAKLGVFGFFAFWSGWPLGPKFHVFAGTINSVRFINIKIQEQKMYLSASVQVSFLVWNYHALSRYKNNHD